MCIFLKEYQEYFKIVLNIVISLSKSEKCSECTALLKALRGRLRCDTQ